MPDQAANQDHVAIIGMAGRFPGAPDIETFWANLAAGREGITFFTEEELAASGVSAQTLRRKDYVKAKGVLADADLFDADFFGYSPREAELMDPQQRIFHECAWEALEAAGYDPASFEGRIGVFGGASLSTYLLYNIMPNAAAMASAGTLQTQITNDKDFLTTRVSYKLDLRGPSVSVQTACSTSLTAVHLACQSLLDGECDIALAGGVSVTVPLHGGYEYQPGGIASPDGHCRAFDASAAGTLSGNGVGIVVLRRLSDARSAGDSVTAVILGTAVNNDGSLKVGYTAPSVDGQAEVIAEALAMAGVDASTVGYVETHGTGTALGDPIEIAGLTRAFREHTQETGFCAIGSVKSNIGHLDAAAGVTGLIKAALALRHEAVPASLHCAVPNPQLALETSPFFVNTKLRPWPRGTAPRRAGISSFGVGGTNVHVILEEAPPAAPRQPSRSIHLLAVSGKTPAALAGNERRLADHLERHPDLDLDAAAYTLGRRRRAFEHRRTVVCRTASDAAAALRRSAGSSAPAAADPHASVAFLFPGQGAQYVTMAADLYQHEPVFAAELDACAGHFAADLGRDLRALLYPAPDAAAQAAEDLEQTALTQPALFAVEYALARQWQAWGVRPRVMAGHSIGEYVAACLAGVFSLPDAARLVALRGRLVQAMPRGAMLAVVLPEPEVRSWLDGPLSVAAVNSTGLSVVGGPAEAVDTLRRALAGAGVACRRLHTSHAFHSADLDGAVAPLVAEVAAVRARPPQIPFYSNVTGALITGEQATSPEYWGSHLRQPVQFRDAIGGLLADPATVMVEVGPGDTLATFVRQHRDWDERRTVVSSLRHPKDRRDDREHLLSSLGRLWAAGVTVDWAALHRDGDPRPVALPGYAFQRERYWMEPPAAAATGDRPATPSPAVPAAVGFATPGWRRLPPQAKPVTGAEDVAYVVLGADLGLGRELVRRLSGQDLTVVAVRTGTGVRRTDDGSWTIDPVRREHYAQLLGEVATTPPRAVRIVHLWSLLAEPGGQPAPSCVDAASRHGFDSLLALAQGIADARVAGPVQLDIVCRGVFSVTGQERLRPENATVLGPAAVIPQEISGVTCRVLDVAGVEPDGDGGRAASAVQSLIATPIDDRELALRGQHWWVRGFDPVPPGDAGTGRSRLRDGGVYLITGGLGGIGLALAEHIASTVQAPALGLLGRSALPAEPDWDHWLTSHGERDETSTRIRSVRALRRLGARVALLRADVTDADQVGRAVRELRDRFGAINGVIHAAGLPSRGMIIGKTPADAGQVLAPKTVGTLVLDQVCGFGECDWVLLCSSLTAVLGGPAQSDYAAANAFLEVYAQHRQAAGAPVTAVGWDTWRGVGMAKGLVADLGGRHPLLDRLVEARPSARTYATGFSTARHWIVDEHRIMGHGLVPGTTYLELVRAAVAEWAGERIVEFHDVVFPAPLIVPDGQTREAYTTVAEDGDRLKFAVRSRTEEAGTAATWREHATGWVSFHDRDTTPVRDLDKLLRECGPVEVIDTVEEINRRLKLETIGEGSRIPFQFGPRWSHSLRRIDAGATRLLVKIELDEEFLSDLDSYALHPALLDLAGAAVRVHASAIYYLPLAYRSIEVSAGLTGTIYCFVEVGEPADSSTETMTINVDIVDAAGRSLVRVRDFTIKRISDVDGLVEQVERAVAAGDHGPAAEPAHHVLRALSSGISAEQGAAAFGRILDLPPLPAHLVVSGKDLAELRRLARSLTPALVGEEVADLAPLAGTHPRPDLPTPYVAPEPGPAEQVAAIWQEVLGLDRVGVHDDFFALGGHSLAAFQVSTKVQRHFDTELDLRDFFDRPTVAGTVELLAARGPGGPTDRIVQLPREEPDTELERIDDLTDDEVDAALLALFAADHEGPGEPS